LFRRRHPRRTALLIGNLACNGLSTVSTAFKRKCHFSSTDPFTYAPKKTSGVTWERVLKAIRPWLVRSTGCCYCCGSKFDRIRDNTT
jgi:hypothetical protein